MNLHIIFYNFYGGHLYHAYLNALYRSKDQKGAILTHKKYIDSPLKYEDIYFKVFDMERVSVEEKESIKEFGISEDYFEDIKKKYSSRTQAIIHLLTERDSYIEKIFTDCINRIGNIDAIYVFGETYESIKYIAKEKGIPIYNYEFSTVRKISDYSMNLMQVFENGSLYSNEDLKKRYDIFKQEVTKEQLLSREELIFLFAPKRQLKYIDYIYDEPKYEIGILGSGYSVVAPYCKKEIFTDDDILYDIEKIYSDSDYTVRKHPATMNPKALERELYEKDTLPFILSCKRITTIASNGLFEAMLWGRTAITLSEAMPYSFICGKNYETDEKVDIDFLNFYLINALVPSQNLLFSEEYWKWRKTASEKDIYRYHLKYIYSEIGERRNEINVKDNSFITKDSIKFTEGMRLCYSNMESMLKNIDEDSEIEYSCINFEDNNGTINSFFEIGHSGTIYFFPYIEKSGFVSVKRVMVNNNTVYENDNNLIFLRKNESCLSIPIDSNEHNMVWIEWKSVEITSDTLKVISDNNENTQKKLDEILESKCWKITKPIRCLLQNNNQI